MPDVRYVGAPVTCIGCGIGTFLVGPSKREGARVISLHDGWIRLDGVGVWFACDRCYADGLAIVTNPFAPPSERHLVSFPPGVR